MEYWRVVDAGCGAGVVDMNRVRRENAFSLLLLVVYLCVLCSPPWSQLTGVQGLTNPQPHDSNTEPEGMNLADAIMNRTELSMFYNTLISTREIVTAKAQAKAGLTIFAPVNAAFEELGSNYSCLLEEGNRIDLLANIARYHMVPLKIKAEELANREGLPTIMGLPLTLSMDLEGNEIVGNDRDELHAYILDPNGLEAATWTVHIIDTFLLPSNVFMLLSLRCPGTPTTDVELLRNTNNPHAFRHHDDYPASGSAPVPILGA